MCKFKEICLKYLRNLSLVFLLSFLFVATISFQYISTPTAQAGTITVGGGCDIIDAFQTAQDDADVGGVRTHRPVPSTP